MDDDRIKIIMTEDNEKDFIIVKKTLLDQIPNMTIDRKQSVLETARAIKEADKVDILLLDLNVHDSIGPRTVADVRKIAPYTPIIVLTGITTDLTTSECMKAGANHVFMKSEIFKSTFIDAIMNLLMTG